MRWGLIIPVVILTCTACAPVISPQVRAGLESHLSYAAIAANPEAHVGKSVMLAGTIIAAKNLRHGTRLEILQFPATHRGRPKTDNPSGGRFLIMSPDYLETAVYRPGRAITVAGRIVKVAALPLGDTLYHYPLIEPQELYLWKQGNRLPHLHIGFGLGFSKSF